VSLLKSSSVETRPLVGITTYVTQARWGHWEQEAALIPAQYVRAVERAGGRAMLVPPSKEGIEETLDALDALILSGGSDLSPETYGQEAHPETYGVMPERDDAELALLTAALERDLPVLAICRGSQVLNVALGGDLVAHIPDHYGEDVLHRHPERRPVEHPVRIEPASRIGRILGTDELSVRSWHHQAVGRIGRGLRAVAWAPDGVVEAVESDEHSCTLAVQWHPEVRALADPRHLRLFEALVEAAGGARTGAVMTWDRDSDSPLAEEPGRKSLRRTTGTAGAR